MREIFIAIRGQKGALFICTQICSHFYHAGQSIKYHTLYFFYNYDPHNSIKLANRTFEIALPASIINATEGHSSDVVIVNNNHKA